MSPYALSESTFNVQNSTFHTCILLLRIKTTEFCLINFGQNIFGQVLTLILNNFGKFLYKKVH